MDYCPVGPLLCFYALLLFFGLESDESYISLIIILFFLIGVGVSLYEAIKLGKDQLHLDGVEREGLVFLKDKKGRVPELLGKIATAREKQQPPLRVF